MEYLRKALGIDIQYSELNESLFPHYLLSRYSFKCAKLDQIQVVFVYSIDELESIAVVTKHLEKIHQLTKLTPVLILGKITYRQRENLINRHISFIVEGKQIYLPFMAIYLQEHYNQENTYKNKLLPSSQLLLLYYMYSQNKELELSTATRDLGLTSMSISRAAKQLEYLGCIKSYQKGVHKIIYSDLSAEELFEQSREYLQNPVKRKVYVYKEELKEELLFSGYSALSSYTFLNDSSIKYYASPSISSYHEVSNKLIDPNLQVAIEFYRYDPKKLTKGNCVDILSLALSLQDTEDERVQKEVEEMLVRLWRNINDQRHQQI